jgi:glutamate racemase
VNRGGRLIAMFDSGLGGLTVLTALRRVMPDVDVVYAADTARVPYGDRPLSQVEGFSRQTIERLRKHDPALLVIACGTTCSAFDAAGYTPRALPALAIVDCGVAAAAAQSPNGRIGVIATAATINSGIFERKLRAARADARVTSVSAPKLVPLVESQRGDSDEAGAIVDAYCEPFRSQGCDTVILGCTHFPLLMPWFARALGPSVVVIDPALACADAALKMLAGQPLGSGSLTFEVTGDAQQFARAATKLAGVQATATRHVDVSDQMEQAEDDVGRDHG